MKKGRGIPAKFLLQQRGEGIKLSTENGVPAYFMFITGICLIWLLLSDGVYAVQAPPPPLDLSRLRTLIAEADAIALGTVEEAQEKEESVEAVLGIEKLLKGDVAAKTVAIEERFDPMAGRVPGVIPEDQGDSQKKIVVHRAGPRAYHGRYQRGMRIVVFLEKIKGIDQYRPLGSGSYDRHLCEFIIEPAGIKTFYFTLADDVAQYAQSEGPFVCLIEQIAGGHEGGVEKCLGD
jgi:hypothetical protein